MQVFAVRRVVQEGKDASQYAPTMPFFPDHQHCAGNVSIPGQRPEMMKEPVSVMFGALELQGPVIAFIRRNRLIGMISVMRI